MKKQEEAPRNVLSYSPNRLEYFAGQALQGLVTGRSEKDIRKCVKQAIALAEEMENEIDS